MTPWTLVPQALLSTGFPYKGNKTGKRQEETRLLLVCVCVRERERERERRREKIQPL